MGRRFLVPLALAAALALPGLAQAARPAVCLLPFSDARPVKSPRSVPFRVRAENAPEPIRAHPAEGPSAVRREVLGAFRAEGSLEVLDLAGDGPTPSRGDPNLKRCTAFVAGAVFHYEGTVAVDIHGEKTFSGLVGYELVALDPRSGRKLTPPVVFAGRRQSDPIRADEEFGSSDRQTFGERVGEALEVASESLPERFVLPTARSLSGLR